jgi:alpha-D-xyloside xylohydrolase
MPYRPPLVAHEVFVADPPELPVRGPGEQGLSAVIRAEVVSTDAGGVVLKGATPDGSTLVVQISGADDGVLRVRLSDDPQARSRSARAATLMRPAGHPLDVRAGDGRITVRAGAIRAEITLDPWQVSFFDASGRLLVRQNGGEVDISGRLRTLPFGRSLADGAVVAYHESFGAAADERFVGLGERFTTLDKRGQRALMWNFDAFGTESDRAYKNVPFYLSNRGYGVVVDSGMPVEFDMCQSTHSCVQIVVPDDVLDYYVLAGPAPADVLDRYNRLTSRPLLPPKWAFGTWMSSGFFADSQQAALERAHRLRADGIPCDVLHLDCYWQRPGHWSDMVWDPETFPDPDAMLAELSTLDFRVCLWINPYVSHLSPLFAVAEEAGYLLRRPDGGTYVADVWHGSHPACGVVDFTNPAATAWFQGLLRPLLEQGVAVFKTDFAEGVPADAVAHNGMRGVELHNVYTLLFNDAAAAVTREVAGHGMVWARSSYLGGQRHSAQWGGDTSATYPAMASTLRGGLSHGLSGVPFWSHDAGGFTGTPTDDLYVRWAQFAALSPLVRFHGTTSRLPWNFPPAAASAATEALRLRYRLLPYLYSAAVTSARTGVPMMRALLVDAPQDPAAWTAELEYLLGPDLLVAPVVTEDAERPVYVPAGRWVDWWTGDVIEGGRYHRVTAAPDRIPLFARHGALIPVIEPRDTVGDGPFPDITVVSWGGVDGRTVISDVDGDTVVTAVRDGDTLALTADGPARIRRVALAPATPDAAPAAVTFGGVAVELGERDGMLVTDL